MFLNMFKLMLYTLLILLLFCHFIKGNIKYFLNLTFNMENHSLAALTKFGEKSEVYDERYF